ncbi:helicase-associated domain-containing protein [Paenibacillus allorhizosphaerae]|uniref:Helicase XPB/Ssl2 N-terminal domain-containing protein n=1 Tax=Paenibacillus allorhizosphaerae TaxID=2849866 RepID=A0ABN7TCM5_9BACL|nr:helicase-associated domain-containing protein [Paenibacillus allorhizosphaerae]CAG7622718.1 hypothetical protein PAECIP111802_00861 [Paenibacillus allorhizosphaerae]
MNYAELLKRMPNELRRSLETELYGPWLNKGVSLAEVCTDPVVVKTIWGRMVDTERTVLRTLVLRIGSEPFDYARLEKATSPVLSGAETRLGLCGLLRKGIVFAFRKTWGEYLYLLPIDGFGLWRDLLLPEETSGCERPGDFVMPEVIRSARLSLRLELFQTLVFAAQHGLKLSKNGTVHKKLLQKLADQLGLNGELLNGASLKYAYADTYPLPVAVALDFLLRLQLLSQNEEELALQPEAIRNWLSASPEAQTKRLYLIWKQLTLSPQAWMQHAVSMAERLASGGEWFSAEMLIANLSAQGITEEHEQAEEQSQELQARWLLPLVAFGWMEEGRSPTGGSMAWFRWTEHPFQSGDAEASDEGGLMIQPDFEILAPPDVPGAVLWELCCLADTVRLDQVSIFKLTKSSVRRALENGRTQGEIVMFLESHALYGLPEHIRLAVEQWAKPFGKTSFMQACLLRCVDEETAQSLERLPGASQYLQDKLGSNHYLIAAEDVKPLAAVLEKAGMMPGVPSDWKGSETAAQASAYPKLGEHADNNRHDLREWTGDKGFIYARTSVAYYEMEARIPSAIDLYPEYSEIPAGWLRDYRSYHASTRKEMVEKAIRLKTVLQIRKDGCDYRITPHKVQETRGSWCMTGIGRTASTIDHIEEMRLMPEEWQEMKLILPGINDKYLY